ncbi:MAG: hypothetical protein ACYDBJ_09005 [Aggregatilineales bacterium]
MSAKTKPNHCRLSIILATEASTGVIFRRGPSNWVQLILWDTHTDTFTEGQWFKGRIYEERCDLSPDGSKLIYFAAKHYTHFDRAGYAWTAISKPPYFTALALWKQYTTYGGGGCFIDNRTVCVGAAEFSAAHKDHLPPLSLHINPDACNRNTAIWLWRLKQSGWKAISEAVRFSYTHPHMYLDEPATVYQKDSPDHKHRLTMQFEGHNSGLYGDPRILTFSLQRNADQKEFLISDTWADWDHRGRLVYVEQGKLFVGELGTDEIEPQLILDFNPNRPKLIKAPAWATTWD